MIFDRVLVLPTLVQAGVESLGLSLRWMQVCGQRADPERYWCGAMQAANRPGLTERQYGEFIRSRFQPTGKRTPAT